jgi:starvation-inducible outer membrane lipoprotein
MRAGPSVGALALTALLAGCGTLPKAARAPAPATEPGWSADLQDLLPAIDTCLAQGGARAVTRAWPMAEHLAGVRLLKEDGSRLDCVAAQSGGKVVLVQPVRPSSRIDDEAAPLYTPDDRQPPQGRCVATTPALVGARRVGWLSYPTCPGVPLPRPPAEGLAPIPPSV